MGATNLASARACNAATIDLHIYTVRPGHQRRERGPPCVGRDHAERPRGGGLASISLMAGRTGDCFFPLSRAPDWIVPAAGPEQAHGGDCSSFPVTKPFF